MAADDPSTQSEAYKRMKPGWDMIDAILGGAVKVRDASTTYLPKYPDESIDEYRRRLTTAPWRAEFTDALQTLASKPFSKDVALDRKGPKKDKKKNEVGEAIKKFSEDVDRRGNNLTVFAREMFCQGIAKGLHGLLVERPKLSASGTLADQSTPYWCHIRADDIIALYTTMVRGREVVEHVRIRECSVERIGFTEVFIERIRVLELNESGKPVWQIWKKDSGPSAGKFLYSLEDSGEYVGVDTIPLVLYWTGERYGSHEVKPPLIDLAGMQMELYRALSVEDEAMTFTGNPMLKVIGLRELPKGEFRTWNIGPRTVIDLPAAMDGVQPDADYIRTDSAGITVIRNYVQSIVDDMRRLGMQPMTQRVGGVTATATGVEAHKAHSVVQWWALSLKDAIERAFTITTTWMKEPDEVEVTINTDFSAEPYAQAPITALIELCKLGVISSRTTIEGVKRFSVLPTDLDPDQEEQALAEEQKGRDLIGETDIDPVTGKPIVDPNAAVPKAA